MTISVRPETLDMLRSMKRGQESYQKLLEKMADQYDADEAYTPYRPKR